LLKYGIAGTGEEYDSKKVAESVIELLFGETSEAASSQYRFGLSPSFWSLHVSAFSLSWSSLAWAWRAI
jgi:hypothetical protein